MTGLLESATQVRRTVGLLAAVAGVGLAAFVVLERPLIGVAVYVLAMIGTVLVQSRAELPVFDERDTAIAQEAAQMTLTIFGWASAGIFPALTVAWGLGKFDWGPASTAIALFVSVLYLTYSGLLLLLQRRR